VISHGDNDHIGGAFALLKALQVDKVLTSVPEKFNFDRTLKCVAQDSWHWDGIDFTFLHPSEDQFHLGNDSSCVLRIDNGQQQILLTGDIEKHAEKILLERAINQLSATIIIAPHHGSKTSGLKDFVSAVNPKFVLYATGYRNRYHFPHMTVMNEYKKLNTVQLNTTEMGATQFKLEKNKFLLAPLCYRKLHKRYWMDD
jgi:competence protein ComEC